MGLNCLDRYIGHLTDACPGKPSNPQHRFQASGRSAMSCRRDAPRSGASSRLAPQPEPDLAATGERITALQGVEPERSRTLETAPEAGYEQDWAASESRRCERMPEPEKVHELHDVEMEMLRSGWIQRF